MTDKDGGKRPLRREIAQIDLIQESLPGAAVYPPEWRNEDVGADYLYRQESVLVRDRDLDRVRALFDGGGVVHDGGIGGLTRYDPPADFRIPDDVHIPEEARDPTPRALAYIDQRLGAGVATPDHVFYVCPVSPCPATEPGEIAAAASPDPGVSQDRCDGAGVKVAVVDVGWSDSDKPWLAGVSGDLEDAFDQNGLIKPYAGHGLFIAGVLRCVAPRAEVTVDGMLTQAGATFESELVPQLDQALDRNPDIISLSAGTPCRNELSSLGFDVFWEERLSKLKGVVLVAAAGNDGVRRPFWPAARPGTVSVGALGASRRERAHFSNFGGWVDVYAPGEYLVNAFLTGRYLCNEPPYIGERRLFDGMARWSGTSFATPLVAGLIAARMSVTGENGREAADALLRHAHKQAIPGVGAALYPGDACAHRDDDHCGHSHDHCGHSHERGCHGHGHHGHRD